MTGYEARDIVLVPYPFGEPAGNRKRPALVLSPSEFNQATGELIIAQITSRSEVTARPGDYRIDGWKEANLPSPALVRARLATLKTSQVLHRLGTLNEAEFQAARSALSGAMLG
jgi:mRNA-degrading endonuclease toxin of MazEF toxin-antitoxin module